ncbi:MAG: autotransporter-associated beta strand repeat-containing protein [Kiritimatiellia bacterium]
MQANGSTTGFWNNNANVTATIGAAGITIDTQAFNDTITQVLGGTGALTKIGTGVLTLGGANPYAGATSVNAGGLTVSGAGTLSGTTALTVAAGSEFRHLPAVASTVLTLGAGATLNLAGGSLVGETFGSTIAAPGTATVGTGGDRADERRLRFRQHLQRPHRRQRARSGHLQPPARQQHRLFRRAGARLPPP